MEKPFRKKAREIVFKTLYSWALSDKNLEETFNSLYGQKLEDPAAKKYAYKIIKSIEENLPFIDKTIASYLRDWDFDSIGETEKAILRLGVAELLILKNKKAGLAFRDYVDILKTYASLKSGKFVNGVLSSIYKEKVLKEDSIEQTK